MGSKHWKHLSDKKRIVGSDTDRVTAVQSYIGRGYSAEQYQTLQTPKGKYPQRRPDLVIKICGFVVPIECDGGVHGFNDDLSETQKTKDRNDDYLREGFIPIILNHEQLKVLGISEDIFIRCAIVLLEPIFRTMSRLQQELQP